MWARLLNNKLLDPIKFPPHLTSAIYRDVLQDQLPNLITDAVEDVPIAKRQPLYCQLDESGPHYKTVTRKFLNKSWPDRWIGCVGPIEWSPRSLDLTPLNFFL